MSRVWRRLALWLGLPAVLAALLLAAAWQALQTPHGLRWAFDWVAGQLPGQLSAAQVEGPLVGPWRVVGLRYSDATGLDLALQEATLDWRPLALLAGRVRVTSIAGRGLALRLPTTDEAGDGGLIAPPRLPLGLRIDDLVLTDIELDVGSGAPQRLASLALAGSITGGGVRLERLRLVAAEGELELAGRLDPWRGYDLDLTGRTRIAWPGQPEVAGRFTLAGDRDRVDATVDLELPIAARAEVRVATPLAQPTWQGRLQVAGADPSRLRADLPPWPTDLAFDGGGTLDTLAGTLAVQLQHPEFGPLAADGALDGDRTRLALSQVTVRAGDPELRLRLASAAVAFTGDTPRFSALGSWQAARWPLTGTAAVQSPHGRFEIDGTVDAYRLELAGRVEAPELPPVEIALAGAGDRAAMALSSWSLALDDGGGRLAGDGTLGWAPALRFDLRGRAEGIDPGRFAAAWPGALAGRFTLAARLVDGVPRWQADLAELTGTLRGQPVSAQGRFSGTGPSLTLDGVTARAGTLEASADGRLGETLDLRWTLASEALDGLLGLAPGLAGRVTARGTLSGPRATPAVTITAEAAALRHDRVRAGQVTLQAHAAAGLAGALDVALAAVDLELAGSEPTAVELTGTGTLAAHRLRLAATAAEGTLELAFAGGLAEQTWRGTLAQGVLASRDHGQLQLEAPVAVHLAVAAVTVADHCWQRRRDGVDAPGTFCGGGTWRADGAWAADLRLADLPLGLFDLLLPGGVELAGAVAGEAAFRGRAGSAIEGRGELRLAPGHIDLGGLIGGAAPLAYAGGAAQLVADAAGTRATFAVDFGGTDRIAGRIALPDLAPGRPLVPDPALAGQVTVGLSRLDLLATLLPTLALGPGRVDASVEIGGTLATPRFDGDARLTVTTVEVPQYGLTLRDVELRAQGERSERLRLQGSARSGEGTVRLDGRLEPDPDRETGWALDLALVGERFLAANLRELRLLVSPDLRLRLRGRDLELSGLIEVPEALIKPRVGGANLQGVSDDTVVVGADSQPEARRLAITADLRLVLGDRVRFEGFGLSGRVSGALDLTQRPDGVPLGSGELRLADGSFSRYGQNLVIESGRLQFVSSPLDDPLIEARAVRVIGEITAGLQIHGTLRQPRTTLFSDPPMSQADTLSYLVLGTPAGRSGGGGGEVVAAAAALGYLADSPVMRELRGAFGIEEVRIESDSAGQGMSLVLGHYLSPELYIGYAVGLTTPTNTFIARYRLTERLSVEASSGSGDSGAFSGADLKYEIER